jgi:hypothetical protein
MYLVAKYNTQTTFTFPVVKRGVVDLAVSTDWTPATGDTKVAKDGGNVANTTNNPAAVGGSGSALWSLTLTASELSCAEAVVQIVDSATKAVEDQVIRVYTYGNASAKFPIDWSDTVRMGLTALPNATPAGSGGLPTCDSSNSVKIQDSVKKNQALDVLFVLTDSTNHAPATGKASVATATRSIDHGAFGAGALGTITELTNGWYWFNAAAADMNGSVIAFRISAPGCDDTDLVFTTST